MNLDKFFKEYRSEYLGKYRLLFPRIECADGMSLSVQANEYAYCMPRLNFGPYTHVEVGFPSEIIPELLPYAEDASDPKATVYAMVPVELVEEIIKKHGGGKC